MTVPPLLVASAAVTVARVYPVAVVVKVAEPALEESAENDSFHQDFSCAHP